MDISVSHLNQRLMLQLPAQLPLGLVFVQGTISNLTPLPDTGAAFPVELDLVEAGHSIRCCLSARITAEISLQEGSRIRAGGHLVFDARRAQYLLQTRDVELIIEEARASNNKAALLLLEKPAGRPALTPVLADIKKRAEAAHLAQDNLPVWVQRMAPPELRTEAVEAQEAEIPISPPTLDEGLVKFLAQAMEDLQDVEITPDLLEEIAPGSTAVTQTVSSPQLRKPAALSVPQKRLPSIDWPVLLLFVSMILLLGVLFLLSAQVGN